MLDKSVFYSILNNIQPKGLAMNKRRTFRETMRKLGKKLRSILFPTDTERKRAWHQEDERQARYEKYIPHFIPKTYATIFSWFPLCMFIFFMTFGLSVIEQSEEINNEAQKEYQKTLKETNNPDVANQVAQHYIKTRQITNDTQALNAWNCVMQPLNLDKNTILNWLILSEGTIIGLSPTLVLAHRKRIVNKMHAEKWKMISPIDNTDRKIIQNMSKDSPNYFHHLTMSLTGPEKLKKYKKIAEPIIRGYMESHPNDRKATIILKAFTGKTK